MKYFIGTVIIIFLILIGAVILVSRSHNGNGSSTNSAKGKDTAVTLTDYARSGTRVIFTTDGIINGDDKHRAIRITVSGSLREIEILQGYDGKVINSQTYDNDSSAYDVFLHALNTANFTSEVKNAKPADEKGSCPTGLRYYYDLKDGGDTVKHLWSTSCGGIGNFGGSPSLTRQLFRQQIPDYGKLTGGVSLY